MGKLYKSKLTTFAETLVTILIVGIIAYLIYLFAPGISVKESFVGESIKNDHTVIDNQKYSDQLPLPSLTKVSSKNQDKQIHIAGYAWNGQRGFIAANGGDITTSNSLMEQNNVNFRFFRQDGVDDLLSMHYKFVSEFDKGNHYPTSDRSTHFVLIMGDGAPYYVPTLQNKLDQSFGVGKYNVEIIGAFGMSYGEDKLIGPSEWKQNPQLMKGQVISAVVGDGAWAVAVNYAFLNGIPVNGDMTTYDEDALNIINSENSDYIKSAEELIKSHNEGWTVSLKEVKNGRLTGNTVTKKVTGCATWTPGDKMVFDKIPYGLTDIISTKEFNNQMPTTLIGIREWNQVHSTEVINMMKSAYIACNQIKQYDEWERFASQTSHKAFKAESPDYWYTMAKGVKTPNYNIGGSRVLNYQDAMQYYGISDGKNRYKAVYEQISKYLQELNPFDFNSNIKSIPPYEKVVNLQYLKSINDIEDGEVYKSDYSQEATNFVASGNWEIQFPTASYQVSPNSQSTLRSIYNLLTQAENTKVEIYGHTDSVGNPQSNLILSENRANSVSKELIKLGVDPKRIQSVKGFGDQRPVGDNTTELGRKSNRRVEIKLLN